MKQDKNTICNWLLFKLLNCTNQSEHITCHDWQLTMSGVLWTDNKDLAETYKGLYNVEHKGTLSRNLWGYNWLSWKERAEDQ